MNFSGIRHITNHVILWFVMIMVKIHLMDLHAVYTQISATGVDGSTMDRFFGIGNLHQSQHGMDRLGD